MADLFQGSPLPAVTSTTQTQATAPEFYTNYLQDIANLGQNAVTQGGVAGPSALQQQAYNMAPSTAFAGSGSMGAGSQLLGQVGSTTAPDVVQSYMNPYTHNVTDEMARLQQHNIQQNVLPNLGAAGVSSGSFGSQRGANATGQTLANMQANLMGQQTGALQTGYQNATTAAQNDLSRQLQAGQSFGNLGAQQQALGLGGLNELATLGGQQQTTQQNILNNPMVQAQAFSKLMQGNTIPTGSTTQAVGPQAGAYSNSPLSQIAGLGTLIASLYPQASSSAAAADNAKAAYYQSQTPQTPQVPQVQQPSSTPVDPLLPTGASGGSVGYADGGGVSGAAYHDGNGNFYDADGYLVN